MNKYNNGLIYMIQSKDEKDDNIYIGSTCDFIEREKTHKNACNNEKTDHFKVYKYINDNGGFDEWKMIFIDFAPCETEEELRIIEQEYINMFQSSLNIKRAYSSKEDKKEYQQEYQPKYYQNKKDNLKVKITCECGSIYRKSDKTRHAKTKKHIQYIESI
tara:strand:+ start:14 stop:493 length:480 start_codon:yes stop_codon:yes gene_type:complete